MRVVSSRRCCVLLCVSLFFYFLLFLPSVLVFSPFPFFISFVCVCFFYSGLSVVSFFFFLQLFSSSSHLSTLFPTVSSFAISLMMRKKKKNSIMHFPLFRCLDWMFLPSFLTGRCHGAPQASIKKRKSEQYSLIRIIIVLGTVERKDGS